jgi:transposase
MAAIRGPRKVRRYSAEFKLKAVQLSQLDGVRVQDVAEALEIHPFMLSKWRGAVRAGRIKARVAEGTQSRQQRALRQLARLKAQYALLKEEHELLKKAIRFCSARRATYLRSSARNRTSLASAPCVRATASAAPASTPGSNARPVCIPGAMLS